MKPLNINTRYLRYLLAVVDEESFSRAAERLRVSQPAISRRVQMIEDELGFALLERLPRKVLLTPQGKAMLPALRDLLHSAEETGALAMQLLFERAPAPRIGVAVYAIQPERSALLADFEAAFPNASFEIETGYTRALLHGLWEGKFDILAVSSPIPDERFEYIALRWFPVQMIIAESSPLAALDAIPLEALSGLSISTWERQRQPRMFDEMIAPLEKAGARLVFPEDQGRLGILTHAAEHGIAAMRSFDEYGDDDLRRVGMVARPMENMRPVAALMLLRLAGKERASARLWSFAQGWARQRGIAQRREDISLAG